MKARLLKPFFLILISFLFTEKTFGALVVTATTVTTTTGNNGLSANNIYPQNNVVVYGIAVTPTGGSTTVSQFVMTGTQNPLSTLFSGARLYHSTNSSYDGSAQLVSGANGAFSNGTLTFSGFSDNISAVEYYYVMVDVAYTGTSNVTNQFTLTSVTASSVTPTITSGAKSPNYTYKPVAVTISSVTTTANNFGLAASPLYPQSNPVALYGLSIVNAGGTPVVSQVDVTTGNNSSLSTYFNNAVLYSSTSSTYSSSATPIAGSGVAGTNASFNNGTITFTGLSQTLVSGGTIYYFVVVNDNYTGSTSSSATFSSITLTYSGGNTTQKSTNGPAYTINPATLTMARVTNSAGSNGLSAQNLYAPQNNAVLYGFSAISAGGSTLTANSFSIGSTNNPSLSTNFSNARLYQSSSSSYDGSATLIAGSTVAGTSVSINNGVVTFGGLSQTITTSTTQYYYLMLDYNNTGTSSGSSTTFSTISATLSTNSTTSATSAGPSYNLNPTAVTLTSVTGNAGNNGLASSPVNAQTNPIALYGVKATTTGGSPVVNQVSMTSNNTSLSSYLTNAVLYSSSNGSYDGSATPIAGTGVSGTNVSVNNGIVTFTGLSQTLSSASPTYYYLVFNYNNTLSTNSTIQFTNTTLTYAAGNNTNTNISGPNYTLNATPPTVTITDANGIGSTANGISPAAISYGQTGIVMFGFSVAAANASATINSISMNAAMGNGSINNYFTQASFKLYRSTTNNYTTGTLTQITAANFNLNSTTFTITGLTDAIPAGQTNNYFIVADYNTAGALSSSIQMSMPTNSITYTYGGSNTSSTETGAPTGVKFLMTAPNIAFAGLNTAANGITPNPIAYNQTGIIMYGFSLTDSNGPTTVTGINLGTTNNPIAQFFSNFNVYSSPTSTFSLSTATLLTTVSPSTGNSAFNITGINESFALNQTKYYFITADWTSDQGNVLPTTIKFDYSDMFQSVTNATKTTSNTTGQTFNLTVPTVTISNYTPGVYTGTTISAGGTYNLLGLTLAYSAPTNMHELNLDVNFPLGGENFTSGYIASVDVVDATTGTRPSYITYVNNNGGNIAIGFNINAPQSITTNLILKVTFQSSFANHHPTAFTICVNSASNVASNFCGNNSNCTVVNNYNVASTGTTCSNTFTTSTTYDWTAGANTTDWNTAGNWSPTPTNGYCPGAGDIARIGVNALTNNKYPIISSGVASTSVGSITFGTENSQANSLTVNTPFTVNGDVNVTPAIPNTNTSYTLALSGSSSLAVTGNLNLGDGSTTPGNNSSFTMTSSVNTLSITGGIYLKSSNSNGQRYFSPVLNITGGSVTTTGINTAFQSSSASATLALSGTATLNLTGTTAFSGLSATGTNSITLNGTGTTVNYTGASQTVYTSGAVTGLPSGVSYYNLGISGSGTKTPNAGTLTVGYDFAQSAATMDLTANNTVMNITDSWLQTGGTFKQGSGAVTQNGPQFNNSGGTITLGSAAMNINAYQFSNTGTFTSGTGMVTFGYSGAFSPALSTSSAIKFNNVTFTNGKTFSSTGSYAVSSTGTLNMGASTKLAANGNWTLNSDASGSATVTALPSGAAITGSVIVQRYMSGGSRNYRYMSSPVTQGSVGGVSSFGVSELQKKMFITGWLTSTTGFTKAVPTNSFDATSIGNPSVFFYYEPDKDPTSRAISRSDYKAFSSIGDQLPVGNGLLIFYRGNRNITDAAGVSKATTSAVPEADTLTNTGTLNQGNIPVYIPTDPRVSTTTSSGTLFVYSTSKAASTLSSTFVTTNTGSTASDGYHLVGNPYASPIDLDKLVDASGNALTGSAYTLSSGGVITGHVLGFGGNTGRYVEQGQGFMVSGTVSSLTFTEACKYATPTFKSGEFIQASKTLAATASSLSQQILNVKLKADTNELSSNETTIAFTNKKDTYDPKEDAYYQYGPLQTNYMISYTSDGQPCNVNQMSTLDSIKVIKLYAAGSTTGLYSFTFSGASSLDPRYKLWLIDGFKKDSLDLSANTVYNFNMDLSNPQTYGAGRFIIRVAKTNIGDYYHLQSFSGVKNNTVVNLNWSTQYEGNYTTFTLQRSTDGGNTYDDLAIIQSNGAGNYQFTDTRPLLNGNNLYRLKQNNIDNVNSYSKIVTIGYQPIDILTDKLWLYPNPTVASIKMTLKDVKASALIVNVYSTNGNLMITNNVTATTTVVQDVSKLQKGTYIVQVTGNDNKSYGTGKFTKL